MTGVSIQVLSAVVLASYVLVLEFLFPTSLGKANNSPNHFRQLKLRHAHSCFIASVASATLDFASAGTATNGAGFCLSCQWT
jgi:hypothetical protein